jgi:hypothetical protein
MLRFLRDTASARKLRLFAVACCRRVSHLAALSELDMAERAADGLVTQDELAAARAESYRGYEQSVGPFTYVPPPPSLLAEGAALETLSSSASGAAEAASVGVSSFAGAGELPMQAALLRDIFGNPFRPVSALALGWLHWNEGTVPKLAQAIYEERAYDRLPVLADALEDAGCTDPTIIEHCHQPGEHVRGCWLLDLVLRKK